ncbi:MAG: hypothetical protein ABS81_18015 [Pseudonocardia sp. SCN 72-86]|nr:MAG: hypothetical protein ABS81_18015 [Pseudonocardia sp. SCN 72-86]
MRAAQVRATGGVRGEELEVVVADLMSDDGWAAAVDGCEQVLHVASPMGEGVEPKDPDVLIRPAREGTLRVLRAAVDAGVPRIGLNISTCGISPTCTSAPRPTRGPRGSGSSPSATSSGCPR